MESKSGDCLCEACITRYVDPAQPDFAQMQTPSLFMGKSGIDEKTD